MDTAVDNAQQKCGENNLVRSRARAKEGLPAVLGSARPSILGSSHQSGKDKEWGQSRINDCSEEHVAG